MTSALSAGAVSSSGGSDGGYEPIGTPWAAPSAASAYGPLANYRTALKIDDKGRWMWTVGAPQPDTITGVFTAATPSLIPGQPWDQDSSIMIAGTYTIPGEYANTLAVTCYVKAAGADINAIAGTVRGEVANGGGAGLMGMGIAQVPGSIGHGAELEADAFCAGAASTASAFLLAGGDGVHPIGRYINMRSGAYGNSPMAGIRFDGSTGVNPVNSSGALLECIGNVAANYGIDLRGAVLNVPFASQGFLVGSAGQTRINAANALFDSSERLSVGGPVGIFNTGGAPVLNIGNQSGGGVTNMGIKAWSSGGWYDVGAIWNDGTTAHFGIPSDYRLKQDVRPLIGALDRVANLKPVRFAYRVSPGRTQDGFLAHEVAAVVSEAVQGVKDGPEMQKLDPAALVPLLVAAIIELKAEVAALHGRR